MYATWLRLAVCIPLLACASAHGPYLPDASISDREIAIKEELRQASDETLREENIVLVPAAADELRLLWQTAARRLAEDQASRAEVSRAIGNVRRVIAAAAGRSPQGGLTREITLEGVESARFSLCPDFYPFC